ncbi:MAG: hypothetical protein JWN07_911 [Hyphomicrobiales bacterium]|nr:hypothetical protein [Hyphomicrobiales bacterium]
MSFQASTSREKVSGKTRAKAGSAEQAQPKLDALQPLLAGAHARGMADAFELAGVAAVMVDAQGMVLHAGQPARELFGPDLRLEFDHLVGCDGESTCAIQSLIGEALGDGDAPGSILLPRAGRTPFRLHARRVPGAATNLCQMLKLLIIIEEVAPRPAGN